MLSPFTTPADVRALLGVNDIEVADVTLGLPVFEMGLRHELRKVSADFDVIALFTAANDKAIADRTPEEASFHEATQYFSSLAAAAQVGISLALAAPKRLTDDKSGVERFSGTPYTDVLDRIDANLLGAKAALLLALASLTDKPPSATTVGFTHFVAVKRGYDPVTGI